MIQRHLRHAFPGTLHFVTTSTRARGNFFVPADVCERLLRVFDEQCRRQAVECLGYVLMPDHFHALLYQDTEGPVIPALLREFKKLTARRCRPRNYPEGPLWCVRYDDVPVPGSRATHTKLNYIPENPVRRGLVSLPQDYPWSSAGAFPLWIAPYLTMCSYFRILWETKILNRRNYVALAAITLHKRYMSSFSTVKPIRFCKKYCIARPHGHILSCHPRGTCHGLCA